jgi:apolipoprotein N-acyltransferase
VSQPPAPQPPSRAALPLPAGALRWLIPLLVLHAGAFFGMSSPAHANAVAWPLAFAPMFLALDLALRGSPGARAAKGGRLRTALRVLGCTYPVGVVYAMLSGDWIVNTAYVFGGMPLALAYVTSWLGYGTLVGLELAFFMGLPFALSWRRPWLCALLVPLWATVWQIYTPRFLGFSYGQFMFPAPLLMQPADVLGAFGLNFLILPLHLLLYGWLRRLVAPGELSLRGLGLATGLVALAFVAAAAYGQWAMPRWAARQAAGPALELVGIQPNFTLRRLASNPALSHSDREQSLRALLDDSAAALAAARREPGVPTVLLWPESVYPQPYFLARGMREIVELWVRSQRVHLILASEDAGPVVRDSDGRLTREVYGAAVHVGPEGAARRVYHKIALIPFGESVPFGDWFPPYARLLHAAIPNIGDFTPGREHTVFDVGGVGIAPLICFDAAQDGVAQGMAAQGARLGVLLANLAWFGPTSVSDQFATFARLRAIENRMPVLMLAQSGESFLVDARGLDATEHLAQFTRGAVVRQVHVPRETSFFAGHGGAVHGAYVLALLAVLAAGWLPGWLPGRLPVRLRDWLRDWLRDLLRQRGGAGH